MSANDYDILSVVAKDAFEENLYGLKYSFSMMLSVMH